MAGAVCARRELPVWGKVMEYAEQNAPGECDDTHVDRSVCDAACHWLAEHAVPASDQPWALFVSFASPHYPLIVPSEFYERYPRDRIDLPRILAEDADPQPAMAEVRRFMDYNLPVGGHARLVARAAYYEFCTFTLPRAVA